MNKKLPIYILIAYFVFVVIILAVQLTSKRVNNYVAVDLDEKLNNAVVIYEKSPIMLKRQNQTFINSGNTSETPIMINGVNYVSLECCKNGFDAVISDNADKNKATVQLNNYALVLTPGSREASLSSAERDKKIKLEFPPERIGDECYIAIRDFADIFDYEIFYYDGLIILSNMKDIFDPEADLESVVKVKELVYNLPIAGGYDNAKSICGRQSDEPDTEEEIFITDDSPRLQLCEYDGDNIYYIDGGKIIKADNMNNMISSAELPEGLTDAKAESINGYVCVTGEINGKAALYIYDMTDGGGVLARTVMTDGKPAGLVYDKGYLYFAAVTALPENSEENETDYIPTDWPGMRYFPEKTGDKILNICSVMGADMSGPADITSFCGVSGNVSICGSGIYIAMADENQIYNDSGKSNTNIYRFGFSEGKSVFAGKIRVSGNAAFALSDKPVFFTENDNGTYNYYMTDSRLSIICRSEGLRINAEEVFGGDERVFIKSGSVMNVMDMYSGGLLGEFSIADSKLFLYNDTRLIGFSQLLPQENTSEVQAAESDISEENEETAADETETAAVYPSIKMTMYDIENPSDVDILSEDVIENTDPSMFSELSLRIYDDVAVLPVRIWQNNALSEGFYTYTVNSIYGLNFNSSDD